MRLLAVLFAAFIFSSPLTLAIFAEMPSAEASSLSSWTRVFHLHDGVNFSASNQDWLNSTGPQNPPYLDYDGDTLPGITIKKNVPPQRFHSWILFPSVNEPVVLDGDISVSVWVKSQGNESGTLVRAAFLDITSAQFADPYMGTEIGSSTMGLVGPFYNNMQQITITVPAVSYSIPTGHFLALAIERGDSINDWLIVHYDRTDYDSYVTLRTSTFISVDEAWTEDTYGNARSSFSDAEEIVVQANVSNPFGAYDTKGANVSLYNATNGSLISYRLAMQLTMTDPSPNPVWKEFEATLPPLPAGSYRLNVTARDTQGWPTWINLNSTVVTVHHFGVSAPSKITANSPFSITISALNESDQVISNWTGPVQLAAYKSDKLSVGTGTLSVQEVTIEPSDNGTGTISNEEYNFAEELIYIRAFVGSKSGWSNLITVASGPVASLAIVPGGDVTVEAGGPMAYFNVTGYDANGFLNSTWTPYWRVSPNLGTISQFGKMAVFEAHTVGAATLNCSHNLTGVYDNVNLNIIAGTIVRMEIQSSSNPLEINEGESESVTAIGYDSSDNVVPLTSVTWYTSTAGFFTGTGSTVTYTAGLIPETGEINARQGAIVASLNVTVLVSPYGPWLNTIQPQIKSEDAGRWDLDLMSIWHDDQGGTSGLSWWVEDVNASLYFIARDPDVESVMSFYTQPNMHGEDQFILWVVDDDGYRAFQNVTVRILSVNDAPRFVHEEDLPDELYVKFDVPYTFDFSYYVSDVDNDLSELVIEGQSSQTEIEFVGVVGTFTFSREIGDFEIVTIEVFDPARASSSFSIAVRGTDDTPPSLITDLEDITIAEGTMRYPAYDLNNYFVDVDNDTLYYSYGFENIVVDPIDESTGIVYISAPYEWSGTTMGTITAKDPTGAIRTDTVMVTVTPVNDFPWVHLNESIYVKYASVYYLYLDQYVSDPDNSMDSLTISLDCPYITHGVGPTGAHRLEFLFPANLTDPVYSNPYSVIVRMDVRDPDEAEAFSVFTVIVTDNFPPSVITPNPDELYYYFAEDTSYSGFISLYDLFADQDDENLTFQIDCLDSYSHVYWTIWGHGSVNLTSEVNWSGTQQIKIVATDPDHAWASLQATIVVTPTNDPPVIDGDPRTPAVDPVPDFVVTGGERSSRYFIGDFLVDSDNILSDLMYTVQPGEDVQIVGGYLYFTLPEGLNMMTVTLQVDDGDRVSNVASFEVGVEKTWAEKIGWPYSFPLVLLVAGVIGYFIGTRLPRPYALENLFLIHNDGRLVTHVTKEENTNLDKDVVSAMFTAVQEFVRDSFQKGEVGLRKMEVGDKNFVIEKGKFAYLALIYSGWPPKEKFEMLVMLMRDIEERYKTRLERWNGTMKALAGVDRMLQEYMAADFKPGAWHEEAEIAEEEWVEILDKET